MMNHGSIINLNEHGDNLTVRIRESKRSTKVAIRVSVFRGTELIVPAKTDFNEAIEFLKNKELWIRKRIQLSSMPINPSSNVIPIFGNLHNIVICQEGSKEITHEKENLIVPAKTDECNIIKIKSYLKYELKREIHKLVEEKCKIIGVKHNGIKIKNLISRWGSCSATNNLSFSWRLVFAPKHIVEYVVVHEICHIIEFNHGPRFWALVAKYCPHYLKSRSWLKQHGSSLHCYLNEKLAA